MYKTLHKKQGSVTVQLRFARSSVTFCAKRDNKFNVPHNMKNGAETENPEFVDWIDLRAETSYMIFCEIPLDGPMSFVKRPYDSYEDFVNEFRHKMERYLPKDFDWDAHLGRFNYSAYC